MGINNYQVRMNKCNSNLASNIIIYIYMKGSACYNNRKKKNNSDDNRIHWTVIDPYPPTND